VLDQGESAHAAQFPVIGKTIVDLGNGEILAGFRYDPSAGGLCLARARGSDARTRFLVLREGEMVFLGSQEELEASQDPYVAKFIPHP